jgi:hypothetical protein
MRGRPIDPLIAKAWDRQRLAEAARRPISGINVVARLPALDERGEPTGALVDVPLTITGKPAIDLVTHDLTRGLSLVDEGASERDGQTWHELPDAIERTRRRLDGNTCLGP